MWRIIHTLSRIISNAAAQQRHALRLGRLERGERYRLTTPAAASVTCFYPLNDVWPRSGNTLLNWLLWWGEKGEIAAKEEWPYMRIGALACARPRVSLRPCV